jgi:hypothetical protein
MGWYAWTGCDQSPLCEVTLCSASHGVVPCFSGVSQLDASSMEVKAIVRVFCVDGPCAGLQYVDADSGLILFCELAGCRRCFYRINHIASDAGRRPDAYFDHLESLPSLTASYAGSADDRDALVGAISQPWRCAASGHSPDAAQPAPWPRPTWSGPVRWARRAGACPAVADGQAGRHWGRWCW